MRLSQLACAALLASAVCGTAQAGVCGGEPPADAVEFRGPVLHVLDGERLCVALGADPSMWAPVRLADAPHMDSAAMDGRGALMAASFGQDVICRIVGRDAEGVVAECRSEAGSVGQLMGEPRLIKAGQSWR